MWMSTYISTRSIVNRHTHVQSFLWPTFLVMHITLSLWVKFSQILWRGESGNTVRILAVHKPSSVSSRHMSQEHYLCMSPNGRCEFYSMPRFHSFLGKFDAGRQFGEQHNQLSLDVFLVIFGSKIISRCPIDRFCLSQIRPPLLPSPTTPAPTRRPCTTCTTTRVRRHRRCTCRVWLRGRRRTTDTRYAFGFCCVAQCILGLLIQESKLSCQPIPSPTQTTMRFLRVRSLLRICWFFKRVQYIVSRVLWEVVRMHEKKLCAHWTWLQCDSQWSKTGTQLNSRVVTARHCPYDESRPHTPPPPTERGREFGSNID